MSKPSRFDQAIDTFFGPETGHEESLVSADEKQGFGPLAILVGSSAFAVITALVLLVKRCAG